MTARRAPRTIAMPAISPCALAARMMAAEIAPGPARRGIASGKTTMSSLRRASEVSGPVMVNARLGRANTISSAMRSRMMPPEACSAGSDTPSWVKMNFPTTAATARTAVAMPHAFKAIRLWDALDCFDVRPAKMTAQSTGPTVAKNHGEGCKRKGKTVRRAHMECTHRSRRTSTSTLQDSRHALPSATTAQSDNPVTECPSTICSIGAARSAGTLRGISHE